MKVKTPSMHPMTSGCLAPWSLPLRMHHVDAEAGLFTGYAYGTHAHTVGLTLFRVKGSSTYEFLPTDSLFGNYNTAAAHAAQLADSLEENVPDGPDNDETDGPNEEGGDE